MNKGLLIKGAVILGLAALSVYAAYPPKDKLNLGLDLQGGIHLVLKVETQDAVRAETDKDMEIIRREIADGGVSRSPRRAPPTPLSTSLAWRSNRTPCSTRRPTTISPRSAGTGVATAAARSSP